MTVSLNDCSWPPLCVNYCGQSVVGGRFQQWSLLLRPAGRYLPSVPRGYMRQYFATLRASRNINKHKINSWAKRKPEDTNMIFLLSLFGETIKLFVLGLVLYILFSFLGESLVLIQFTWINSANSLKLPGEKVSQEVRWKQKWKRFKSNFESWYCL